MWEINYGDKDKFYMSLGLGILLGGFILFISQIWITYEKIENLSNLCDGNDEEFKKCVESKSKILSVYIKCFKWLTYALLIVGAILFFIGYFPWIKGELKKDKGNIKDSNKNKNQKH